MKKLSKRDKRVLTIGGILAGAILVVMYAVLPFFEAQQKTVEELKNKERLLQRAIQTIQKKALYEAQLEAFNRAFDQYRRNLLDAPTVSDARIQLEETVREIARQNNIQVQRSNPLPDRTTESGYARITIQINLEADTTQLTNFLYALSTHPKFLVVDEVYLLTYRIQDQIKAQPRMNVSGFVRLS